MHGKNEYVRQNKLEYQNCILTDISYYRASYFWVQTPEHSPNLEGINSYGLKLI
jgi:hypothetical protein